MATPIILGAHGGANLIRVRSIAAQSGTLVAAGQPLFDVETYKVTQEVASPAEGILVHALVVGADVSPDHPIAFVAADAEEAAALSDRAQHGPPPPTWQETIADRHPSGAKGKPVSVAKATEIAVLGGGASNSNMSMVGTVLGRLNRSPAANDFFSAKILDLLVFETAKLLAGKKFRKLNAWFHEGAIYQHEQVNAGVSFDEGGRLTLYSVAQADTLSLPDLQDRIVEGLMGYVGRKLAPDQVSTASYTISDMSGARLQYGFPLLPRGQTLIIALTLNEADEYSLFMSFDHRVSEGMVAAAFLTDLVARLRSYDVSIATEAARHAPEPEPECSFCGRSLSTETGAIGGKGLLRIRDASNADAFCCSVCWNGW